MNKFRRYAVMFLVLELGIILLGNTYLVFQNNNGVKDKLYKVEASRLILELNKMELSAVDMKKYPHLIRVGEYDSQEICNHEYQVEEVNGKLYRIEYQEDTSKSWMLYMNFFFGIFFLLNLFLLWFVGDKILKPFHIMSSLPLELAKGNLAIPLKEEKNRYFGKFLWGMNMLREHLESSRERELELQKEKKTLILSLSHDIKTPLSTIELYAKAMSAGLYEDKEKQQEVVQGILKNTREIESYVKEITKASREDFLDLQVSLGEFYLSEVISYIGAYYQEKLSVLHTEFTIEEFRDCLLLGDKERMIEVLQNIMENAIKYGDGHDIRISFGDEEDCRLIYIENSGAGLMEEEVSNLFDSFYRGSNSQGIQGSGLGLYICKELMKAMDGDVYVKMQENRFWTVVVVRRE